MPCISVCSVQIHFDALCILDLLVDMPNSRPSIKDCATTPQRLRDGVNYLWIWHLRDSALMIFYLVALGEVTSTSTTEVLSQLNCILFYLFAFF